MRKKIVSWRLILCIAVSLIPVTTIAADWISHMTVSIGSKKHHLDVNEARPIKVVNSDGTNGTYRLNQVIPDTWIVKMEYNAGGTPTLTLRNVDASEISGYPNGNTAPVKIVLVGKNTLTSATSLNAAGYDITFSGTGSLDIKSNDGIGKGTENITIEGGNITVDVQYAGVKAKTFTIKSGSLSVKTIRPGYYGVDAQSIIIKGGTLESQSYANALRVVPDLSSYANYQGIGGTSKVYTHTYDPVSGALYKYVKIGPAGSIDDSEETESGVKPFYAVAWDEIDESLTPNINECVFLRVINNGSDLALSMSNVGTDLDDLAAYIKMSMDALPEGMRYLCIPAVNEAFIYEPEAIIYTDTGINKLKALFTTLMQKYYALGGKLDGLLVDLEHTAMGAWYIYALGYGGANGTKNIYNDIVNHPKYQTEVRPLLEERGFEFFTNVGGEKSEIWNISYKNSDTNATNQCIWDVAMRIRLSQYMNKALFEPMNQYYPDAVMSDYQATDTYGWLKDLHDDGGRAVYLGGNSMKTGNASNFNFYASRPGNNYYVSESTGLPIYNTPPAYLNAVYKRDAYNMLLWDMQKAKNMVQATDTGLVNFWIATYDIYYGGYASGTYANTPYYSEMVLHFGLLNPQPFLLYLYKGEYMVDGVMDGEKYNAAVKVVSELLDELTRMVGAEDRQPIDFPYSWNDGYLLTGMTAGGKNIWRITPDTTAVSVADFKVDATHPTFSVNGKTVTFPQGTIVETAEISQVGTCGYWVVTPADVMPVVKADADRFETYPAYSENYEDYTSGAAYTTDTALPAATWTVSGNATVQASNGNKALSVSGNFSLKNSQLPQNITAGDSYAKHQAWEVTVTLPANLPTNSSLSLLSTGYFDAGFKISSGKVSYSQGFSSNQIAGVDLSAGGTYTFKRVFDFSASGAYKCSYYVYNAAGALLGSAENVQLSYFTAPVTAITISGSNMGNATILLDDYKLYITGFAGDFEVYDAEAGVQINAAASHSKDTAYRFSWANAGEKVKNAVIVASFYDSNDTLLSQSAVKTLRLVPGNDGVETGIVEVPQGQKVILSIVYGADTDPVPQDFVYAEAVHITKQPESAIVVNGATAKVTFTAQGDGLTYRWYYREKGVKEFTLTNSFKGNTYSVQMNTARAGRQVCCIVTDKYGNSVQTAIVTLGMKVSITKQPANTVVTGGQQAKVTFTATGEDLTYRWYYRNKGETKFTLTNSFKGNTYSVKMDSTRAGRQVCCIVTDRYGNFLQTDIVTLGMGATITKQPTNTIVANGATAKVTVSATGEGLTYQWYFKNKGDTKFSLTTTFTGNTYTAPMSSARAGRQVHCVITDKYGNSVKTNTVTLGMKVSVTKQPTNSIVANGATAKVTVSATGEGLTYQWYFKNKGASKFTLTTSFKGNTYSVPMTAARSGRQLYCVITDKYGNTVTTKTVTIAMKATITKQPVNVTVVNGATAKVTVSATGEGLTYQWYFKNKGDSKFSLTNSFTGNTYKVVMNAARNGRQLYCVITDKYGNSVQTNTVTIKMK